jgi:CheY-like chemotaxis protein
MLRATLEAEGYAVEEAGNGTQAIQALRGGRFLAVVTDLKLPGADGQAVLDAAREADPNLPVILMTAYGTVEDAVGAAEEVVPAPLDSMLTIQAQRYARLAHERLGCRDFSRVDIMLSDRGELFVLEVNTIPGLTVNSLLPKAAKAAGIKMTDLCVRMVEMALARRPLEVAA